MSEESPLRVTQLTVKDFKCLEALSVNPGRRTVTILRGPNEAGKTTAIDAIVAALGGKRARPEMPIRHGQDSGSVAVVLSDELKDVYSVKVLFREGKPDKLTVVDLTGERERALNAGQTLLDPMCNDLSFDPLEFQRAKPAEQVKMLLTAGGLLDEYKKSMEERKVAYDERTEINRLAKSVSAELSACPDPAPGKTLKRVSDGDLAKQMQDAQDINNEADSLKKEIETLEDKRSDIVNQIERLQERHEAIIADLKLKNHVLAATERVDTAELQSAISEAAENNKKVDRQENRQRLQEKLLSYEAAAKDFSDRIEEIDAGLVALLNESSLAESVPGLEIRDGSVFHNGSPLEQASGMRQLQLSCLIGMAANPRVHAMLIDEADKLDDESIEMMTKLAEERDYGLWMTGIRIGDESNESQYICDIEKGNKADG